MQRRDAQKEPGDLAPLCRQRLLLRAQLARGQKASVRDERVGGSVERPLPVDGELLDLVRVGSSHVRGQGSDAVSAGASADAARSSAPVTTSTGVVA